MTGRQTWSVVNLSKSDGVYDPKPKWISCLCVRALTTVYL